MDNHQMKLVALGLICTVIILLLIVLAIFLLAKALKKFLFELIDHVKGTDTSAKKSNYKSEAWKTCERVTPRKDKHETPPWEK